MHNLKTIEMRDVETTKQKVIGLLAQAKDEILMSTGLNSDFYNDAKIKTTITDAFRRVKKIRIIIDGDVDLRKTETPWFFELAKELNQKLQMRQNKDILHWLVVDNKNCRLEKVHQLGRVGTENLVAYDVPLPVLENIKDSYNKWWDEGKPIDP
ncbi:MAG: hypothetical protein O8C61_04995 [Candidatus Methanoperedens sp.]|nr:hypothetical protein [Candidatus Methanoperedens sp.]